MTFRDRMGDLKKKKRIVSQRVSCPGKKEEFQQDQEQRSYGYSETKVVNFLKLFPGTTFHAVPRYIFGPSPLFKKHIPGLIFAKLELKSRVEGGKKVKGSLDVQELG